jgi:pimeloyl-ACP methyl ester carboxylesterase
MEEVIRVAGRGNDASPSRSGGGGIPMETVGTAREAVVRGVPISWSELGSGPELILVHGLQDSHRTWRRVAPLLASSFRVLMPDLPGHGWSGRPDEAYTLPWYARILDEWMATIGVERAHVCGHSLGAGIVQWMLLAQRERIRRLALVDAGGLGREVGIALRLAAFPVLGRWFTPAVLRMAVPVALSVSPAAFGHMEPEEVRIFLRMSRIPGTSRAFQRSLEAVIDVSGQHQQTMTRAREIESLPPLALFWGERDPIIPVKHGRALVEASSGVTLTVYPGCGHHPHLDAPAAFARDLRAFLSDPDRPAARLLPVGTPVA